jgi:hypothetical protein
MNLTDTARKELGDILFRDFGERAKSLSNLEVDELGSRLLKLTAIAVKRKMEAPVAEHRSKDFSLQL